MKKNIREEDRVPVPRHCRQGPHDVLLGGVGLEHNLRGRNASSVDALMPELCVQPVDQLLVSD